MLEMIRSFPQDSVKPQIVSKRGPITSFFAEAGIPCVEAHGISQFDITAYGFYRGLRWLILFRELLLCPVTIAVMVKAKKQFKEIDLVHLNEVNYLLPLILAAIIYQKPVILHTRLPVVSIRRAPLRVKLTSYLISRLVSKVIAIDETVRTSLPDELGAITIHNGFYLEKYIDKTSDAEKIKRINSSGKLRIAIVGILLKVKGVYDFIEAAIQCLNNGLQVEFYIVGENTRDTNSFLFKLFNKLGFADDVKSDIQKRIRCNEFQDSIKMLGFISDVRKLYENIDVLCFPSHYNAVGRPVFEAAFYKVPSIVAITNPLDDAIIDGVTGICVPPENPSALANAIEFLCQHPEKIGEMGEAAHKLAWTHYNINTNARQMLSVYHEILEQ